MIAPMERIALPETNFNEPDAVLAQTVAADSGWLLDDAGHVYDAGRVIIARSLFELAPPMRELGWFVPVEAAGSGVFWDEVPDKDERATAVRRALRRTERRAGSAPR